MAPMDDRELNALLGRWNSPDAPGHLRPPRRPIGEPWWRWLVTGTIRVPVPVGLAVGAAFVAVWMYRPVSEEPAHSAPVAAPVVSLADFQPVKEVEVRVVGEMK